MCLCFRSCSKETQRGTFLLDVSLLQIMFQRDTEGNISSRCVFASNNVPKRHSGEHFFSACLCFKQRHRGEQFFSMCLCFKSCSKETQSGTFLLDASLLQIIMFKRDTVGNISSRCVFSSNHMFQRDTVGNISSRCVFASVRMFQRDTE